MEILIEGLKNILKDEGFVHVYDWYDKPDVEYPAHAHKGKVAIYITQGSVTFWFGQEEVVLPAGARFDVPVGVEHVAKVGPDGCTYVVGEMIKGDS